MSTSLKETLEAFQIFVKEGERAFKEHQEENPDCSPERDNNAQKSIDKDKAFVRDLSAILKTDFPCEYQGGRELLLRSQFLYHPYSGKWRKRGKKTWYRSKNINKLMEQLKNG